MKLSILKWLSIYQLNTEIYNFFFFITWVNEYSRFLHTTTVLAFYTLHSEYTQWMECVAA